MYISLIGFAISWLHLKLLDGDKDFFTYTLYYYLFSKNNKCAIQIIISTASSKKVCLTCKYCVKQRCKNFKFFFNIRANSCFVINAETNYDQVI